MFDIRGLWKKTLQALVPECFKEEKLNAELIDRFYKYGVMPDSDNHSWKRFLKCCHDRLHIFSFTNEVNVKKWADTFDYLDYSLALKCADFVEPDPFEKSYLMVKCVHGELSKEFRQ
ncbi:hypothetical protein ILUMI_03908 [Ignelater luminosus]|uniref:Uncharacterized protein n=1 Tax=Ignelater luminosus TaxID=2038154 RepID=A0A8K0D9X4_IGNLU|nr:hypothetical protein ILUMI_03908 [Ignelater luminosus]